MNKCLSAIVLAALAMATGACQQPTAQQLNATNANSRIYLGALTCNVSGSTGFVFYIIDSGALTIMGDDPAAEEADAISLLHE